MESKENGIKLVNGFFFFFGCWNRRHAIYNDKGEVIKTVNMCTDRVVDDIKTSSINYDFGVVLGDNIYPDDAKVEGIKMKVFIKKKMDDGLKLLQSIEKPLHIVLGNHDVEDCEMLGIQMESLKNWNFKSNLYDQVYNHNGNNIRLICIDTNVISNYNPLIAKIPLTDYDVLLAKKCTLVNNKNLIINPEDYYLKFKQMLEPDYNKGIQLIIISGHEPLLCGKLSKGKIKKSEMFFLEDLMKSVKMLGKIKVVYICADTHCFLDTVIKNGDVMLRQIIVGTGGASPDVFTSEFIKAIKDGKEIISSTAQDKSEFRLYVKCAINAYGYCSFDIKKFMVEEETTDGADDMACMMDQTHSKAIMYIQHDKNTHDGDCFGVPKLKSQQGGSKYLEYMTLKNKYFKIKNNY
jgi:hypothetical protein